MGLVNVQAGIAVDNAVAIKAFSRHILLGTAHVSLRPESLEIELVHTVDAPAAMVGGNQDPQVAAFQRERAEAEFLGKLDFNINSGLLEQADIVRTIKSPTETHVTEITIKVKHD